MILLQQGAEAKVYKLQQDNQDIVVKQRLKKSYRHPDLDKRLIKRRNEKEYKILLKLQNLKLVPNLISKTSDSITMEFISNLSLKDVLLEKKSIRDISQKISKMVSQLHSLNVIHGDLTCSNILFKEQFYFIDFGLGFISSSIEDKAVDLYVLKKSLDPEISQEVMQFL